MVRNRGVLPERRVGEVPGLRAAGIENQLAGMRRVVEFPRRETVGEFLEAHLRRQRFGSSAKSGDSRRLMNRQKRTANNEIGNFLIGKIQRFREQKPGRGAGAILNNISRASLGTVLCFRVTAPALRFDIWAKNPSTFGILAADKLGRGGEFGDKSGDSGGIYFGERTFGTEIFGSTRKPNEAATCIEDQMESLRRSTEAERSRVSSIAMWGERRFGNGVGFGFGFGGFDLMGSVLGSRGEEIESLEWI